MRKLIRDKYKDIIRESDLSTVYTDSQEYKELLLEKLNEELTELKSSQYNDVTEYADVIEVLLALGKFHKKSFSEIMEATLDKRQKKGSFDNGLILDVPDNKTK